MKKIGIFGTSLKKGERRVPIHPEHLPRYPEGLRRKMVFEAGYGLEFGFPDGYFAGCGAAVADREALLGESDLVVLPKPMPEDLGKMKPHQVLFGWCHTVQQATIAQLAIDNRITLIAWEAMHHWSPGGDKLVHIFYKNNELAGFAAVEHCLQLLGIAGSYGRRSKAVVLSYGSVSRGAIYALQRHGLYDIHVFTRRPPHLVGVQNPEASYGQYYLAGDGRLMARDAEGGERPLIDELSSADVICNGILQDAKSPMIFVREDEIQKLKPRSIIIDISCDEGMGFSFARPTSFADPIFRVGEGISYYSVDHVPTYFWRAASREISKALLPYLGSVAGGPAAWALDPTIQRAVDVRDGVVLNRDILEFQHRHSEYPHQVQRTSGK